LVAEEWVDGWGVRNGWIGGQREKVRGVYRFSSLMKQNKKAKNCAVFCFAGKRKLLYLYLRCDYMGKIKKALLITTYVYIL
jgi:hypothetical protein